MKLLIFAIVFLLIILALPFKTEAHTGTSQPYILLNRKYTTTNEIRGTILPAMDMPGDIAPQNYSVGEKIIFEIDTSKALISGEILTKTKFYWDYGDEGKSEGIKSVHTYKKPGSYILRLSAGYLTNNPMVLDSVLIHVLPLGWQSPPHAFVTVQGKKITDPKNDLVYIKPGQKITLEASYEGGGKKLQYFWDLGDGGSSTQQKLDHTYPTAYSYISPIIKIQDENGYISYSYANIEFSETPTNIKPSSSHNFYIVIGVSGIVTVIILLTIFILRKKLNLKKS